MKNSTTEKTEYNFQIFLEDGEKHFTGSYNVTEAKKLWLQLEKENEVFDCLKSNPNDNYLTEINSINEIN